ncbi:MAG: hypothetical protein ACP5JW_05580, partial [Candidatus Bathyarchaeia archaeon]
MCKSYEKYVEALERQLEQLYSIAAKAREKGVDPESKPECMVAMDM